MSNVAASVRARLLLFVLLERETLDERLLARAIAATFARRGVAIPSRLPVGLTDEFALDTSHRAMWQSFLKKNKLQPLLLNDVVNRLRAAFLPLLEAAQYVPDEFQS